MGVQSTTLYLMSSMGYLPRADYAIFADTGAEKIKTHVSLNWLKKWQNNNSGIPIIHSAKKSIKKDLLYGRNTSGNTFASIPAYTKSLDGKTGMLRRQCTHEYKIAVVDKEIRELYGLAKYKRLPLTEIWFGITMDEVTRVKDSTEKWKRKIYPFLNLGGSYFPHPLTRGDCRCWLEKNKFPVPVKSACIFCPYQGDKNLLNVKKTNPNEWQEIVNIDHAIRNSSKRGVNQPIYLHRSCVPIDKVIFDENQGDFFENECEGLCGI